MMLGNTGAFVGSLSEKQLEEEMYKELFKATVQRSNTVDLDLVSEDLETIGRGAFMYSTFRNINLPNVTTISGPSAFERAKVYGDIHFPNLTTCNQNYFFSNASFYGNVVSMPKLTSLPSSAFYEMFHVGAPKVYLDSATSIGDKAFYNCHHLAELYAPRCTTISGKPFLYVSCKLVLGSPDIDSGMTMADLVGNPNFPFNAYANAKTQWYCRDGIVTYDTAQAAWVQTPYSDSESGGGVNA